MPGLDLAHVKFDIVEPALVTLGLMSTAALNLVTGTAIAESGLVDLHQVDGPALGLWQMEPATEQSLWTNYLAFNREMKARVTALLQPGPTTAQLVGNLPYAAAMCRLRYYDAPNALPAWNDARGLCSMWKTVYNTAGGAGSVDGKHIDFFQQAINSGVSS